MIINELLEPQILKALIVCVDFDNNIDFEEMVNEGISLASSGNYKVIETITMKRKSIDRRFFIGSGKVEEIMSICNAIDAKAVIINHNLSAIQERNLEVELKLPVIDRTRLILEIFSSRAKSNEGVLQVELANESHQLSRLVKRWSHLERQRGGIGMRGGPGEKQMELDKRMIKDKIKNLKMRLAQVVKQRHTQRKSRTKQQKFSISIVGYTNAGKSTLFNILTKANVYAEDRLFATLDTTSRKLFLNTEIDDVVISDTVGFIHDLPHSLVAAFQATLEETVNADLLLNVVDVSQTLKDLQVEDVNKVLSEIKADNIPQLVVYNKIDLSSEQISPHIQYNDNGIPISVYISAINNLGIDLLRQAIIEIMSSIQINNNFKHQELVYEPWKN